MVSLLPQVGNAWGIISVCLSLTWGVAWIVLPRVSLTSIWNIREDKGKNVAEFKRAAKTLLAVSFPLHHSNALSSASSNQSLDLQVPESGCHVQQVLHLFGISVV
jgi:hypothetical protein